MSWANPDPDYYREGREHAVGCSDCGRSLPTQPMYWLHPYRCAHCDGTAEPVERMGGWFLMGCPGYGPRLGPWFDREVAVRFQANHGGDLIHLAGGVVNINGAFPSKYLKAHDLAKPTAATISHVTVEEIGDGEPKPVVHFKNAEKGLVLNKTNASIICEVLGTSETDDWAGKRITLYATKTEFQGKRVDCIRVSDQPPQASGNGHQPPAKPKPPAPAEFEASSDDVPF